MASTLTNGVGAPVNTLVSDISILSGLTLVLRHWRTFIVLPVVSLLIGVLLINIAEKEYEAESSFIPNNAEGASSRLAGMATAIGIASPVAGTGLGPDFFADVLKSWDLLQEVALSNFIVRTGEGAEGAEPQSLIEIYNTDAETEEGRLRAVVAKLRQNVATRVSFRSGMVTLTTSAPTPELAVQINRRMLETLQQLNVDRRQAQARAERDFFEIGLQHAQGELEAAEQSYQRFQLENRSFVGSPTLSLEAARMERQIELRQKVYIALADAYEQARVQELRATPVVTIFDSPKHNTSSIRRGQLLRMILATACGFMLALVMVVAKEYWNWARKTDPDRYQALVDAWHSARGGLGGKKTNIVKDRGVNRIYANNFQSDRHRDDAQL